MKPISIKPENKGLLHSLLHKKLGVPQGRKIPPAELVAALKSPSPALRKEVNFARNFGGRK